MVLHGRVNHARYTVVPWGGAAATRSGRQDGRPRQAFPLRRADSAGDDVVDEPDGALAVRGEVGDQVHGVLLRSGEASEGPG